MSYAVVPRAGVGWLPVFSWIGSLVGQKYGAHTASTVATAQQAAQEVVSSSALPTTTGPEQAQLFDLFKACANPLATVAGYRQVPMTAPTAPGAPLNSPKTCGLAKDPVSAGCPYRDYVLAFCTRVGERFEPLTKMTTEEREVFQAEAAKRVAQENAEAAKKPSGFWDSPATLGVAAVVVGTLVFMEYRRRNRPKKNPRHRPRRNGSLRKGDRVEVRKVWAYSWPEPSKEWFKGYVFVKYERGGKDVIVIGTRGVFSGEPIRIPATDVRKDR